MGRHSGLDDPLSEMTVATHTALNATKNAGPLVADRVKDAEKLLNDVLAFEQFADILARQVEIGAIDRDTAKKRRDHELRKHAATIRSRWDRLTTQTKGMAPVLRARAFPDPGRDEHSAEVKADVERKLGSKKDKATDLLPAMVDLAHDALNRGDTAMVSHLAGDFGQTLITNAMAGADDRDRREAIGEVRGAIIKAASSSGRLTDRQASAVAQLERMDDVNDAVTASVFLANQRFDDAFAKLPWDEGDRDLASRDPDRSPFIRDPMRGI